MKSIMYYAVKGMIASADMDAIETLTKRLSILAERRPELCELMIEGVAISARVFSNDKLCKLLNLEAVENVKCHVEVNDYLHQDVYVEFDYEGKHRQNIYNLPLTKRLEEVFDVEYI